MDTMMSSDTTMPPDQFRASLVELYGDRSNVDLSEAAAPELAVEPRSILRYFDGDRAVRGPLKRLVEKLLEAKRAGR